MMNVVQLKKEYSLYTVSIRYTIMLYPVQFIINDNT